MDTTRQSATKQANEKKSEQTERESQKPITSDSSSNLGDKEICSKTVTRCEMLEDTPFMVVETEDEAFLAIGKYRMEQAFKNKEEALKFLEIKTTNWKAITFVLSVIKTEIEEYINQRERSLK